MPKAAFVLTVLMAATSGVGAQDADEESPGLLIAGGRVLDIETGTWRENHAVVVRGGRVVRVAEAGEIAPDGRLRYVDAGGLYLVPGLIDLHTHLLLHPYDEASWNDQVLREPLELRLCRAVTAARRTLEAGFTTVRELGTEGAAFADVGLRRAIAAGLVTGPRLFVATRALVATGCYGPSGFDPRWALPKGAQVADGVDGVRRATREQIAAGADWIKLYADYRRRPGDASTPTFSAAEIEAIVDEARSAGLPVAAHAVTDAAIRRAVEAGVRTIEHGYEAGDEVLALMRKRGVVLCPTLTASESMARYSGWSQGDPEPPRIKKARAMFERARAAGVTIACGSDAGVFTHGDNVRELELMVAWGMEPLEALRAATSRAAAVLGKSAELGRLEDGFRADIVAVAADPLSSPSALREPRLVVAGGRVIVRRPAARTEDQLVAMCRRMLADHAAGRGAAFAEAFAPGAVVAASSRPDGPQTIAPVAEFVKQGVPDGLRRLAAGPARVIAEGNVATVWMPFFTAAAGRRTGGTDVFQLLRSKAGWKVLSLTRSSREL